MKWRQYTVRAPDAAEVALADATEGRIGDTADYIVKIEPGPSYQILERKGSGGIGVFPPTQPVPPGGLGVALMERKLSQFLVPERN